MMPTWRFQPYGMPRAHSSKHTNTETGPSNLAPPLVLCMTPPPTNPSGGTSEATADATNTQTAIEEDVAPVSNFYCSHIPHVTE